MTTQTECTKLSETEALDAGVGLRYVARQPILDTFNRLHGYELLFRSGPEGFFRGDSEVATRTMLDNTVVFGLEQLTGGHPAFVKCSASTLTEQLVDVLPAGMTIIEVLDAGAPNEELIAACRKLKTLGYRLALGSCSWEKGFEPLVELADYIKVDFSLYCQAGRRFLQERVKRATAALVAEKIETQEDYRQARAEGFTLFQGYFFCHPELLKNRKLPGNQLAHIKILELLQSEPLNMNLVAEWVKRDPLLTLRLLRLSNSPLCGMRQEVRSIELAMMVVGEDAFRRIAMLAIASELNSERPTEILRMAFVRGRFCELASALCPLAAQEQYLLGMLSLLPAMLCLPMNRLTPELPLRTEIREALDGATNPERILLNWLECHERADWAACDAIARSNGLKLGRLVEIYAEALVWAESVVQYAD